MMIYGSGMWNARVKATGFRSPRKAELVAHRGLASVQLTLDRYSHWMPSMGRNTAEGIDETLG
jgi:hypothetical protein